MSRVRPVTSIAISLFIAVCFCHIALADTDSLTEFSSISLKWLEISPDSTQNLGSMQKGLMCLPAGSLTWKPSSDEKLEIRRRVSEQINPNIKKSFEERFGQAESKLFEIGVKISNIKGSFCNPKWLFNKKIKGKVSLSAMWVLYDTKKKLIIFEKEHMGSSEISDSEEDGHINLISEAVLQSLNSFLQENAVAVALSPSMTARSR
jgi:hypothetical protein